MSTNYHCGRCGYGYDSYSRPSCECAGDPPRWGWGGQWVNVQAYEDAKRAYAGRVDALRHRPATNYR